MGRWPIFCFGIPGCAGRTVVRLMATTRQALVELLEPSIEGLGFELADLDYHPGRRGLLRVFIDAANGVTLDDCEAVSRQVSSVLDVADPIKGEYSLEVSSPGLDRRLVKPAHFDRFAGAEVQLKLRRMVEGRRRIKGTLLAREGESISVRSEEAVFNVPLADVEMARLVPDLRVPSRK